MVDFFTRQERSRRATRVLTLMFVAAVTAIVLAVTLAAALLIGLFAPHAAPTGTGFAPQSAAAWTSADWRTLAFIAAITAAFIGLASLYRSASLAAGGGQVARMLGAIPLDPDSTDPLHRRLLNVTEEMAIASGVPVPEIFVLEHESAINAFAAGLSPANAAIAVTRGALEQLDRAELQGVVAHEFSHILNGDMRINQRLIGLCYGILVLTLIGRLMLHGARFGAVSVGRRGRADRVAGIVVIGLLLIVIGSIGVFFSRLIKAAISRQRELLADASAVQFTRDPGGLAGALKKIGGYGSRLRSVDSEEIAHMLFARSSRAFSGLFATHPPLPVRIRALDPTFSETTTGSPPRAQRPAAPGTAAGGVVSALAAGADTDTAAATLLDHAGEVGAPEAGCALRAAIPDELLHAAHARDTSMLLVLSLALADDERVRDRQIQLLESRLGADRTRLCTRLHNELRALDTVLRLPLLELAVPALRQRPAEQLEFLFELLQRVTTIDGKTRLADFVLVRVLAAYLPDVATTTRERTRLPDTDAALECVLTAVAGWGHETLPAARAAFAAGLAAGTGMDAAVAAARADEVLRSLEQTRDLDALDTALDRLVSLPPAARRRVLTAILAAIRHDHRVDMAEVELFRAIGATLDCPLPPIAALGPSDGIR